MVRLLSLLFVFSLFSSPAQAGFISIDGQVAPLMNPLSGRFKVGGGDALRHFLFEANISNIPVENVVIYKGLSRETRVDYPVFIGFDSRYYFLSPLALTAKRNDIYLSLGLEFPVSAQNFLPGFKIGGGYSLRLHRRIFLELGLDYYFYGTFNNELFVGPGLKVVF